MRGLFIHHTSTVSMRVKPHGYGTLFASSRNDDPDYAQTNIHMSITEKKLEFGDTFRHALFYSQLNVELYTGSTSFHHRMEIGKPEYAPDPLHRQHQCWIPQLRRDHLGHARPHLPPNHRNLRGKQHALQLLSRVHLVVLYLHYTSTISLSTELVRCLRTVMVATHASAFKK
jgi:hypothetical protein